MELSALPFHDQAPPEAVLRRHGYVHIAGVDEAGRGPLAGPVVAAAVILPHNWGNPDIDDSKKLTERKRLALYDVIRENATAWNWALAGPDEIDRINILQATLLAMHKAVAALAVTPDYLIIDGTHRIPTHRPQTPLVKGDSRSMTIAAASIIAKVVRDAIMIKYHHIYPHYNFARNKGYGTREHVRALRFFGACPIHRRSFAGVVGS